MSQKQVVTKKTAEEIAEMLCAEWSTKYCLIWNRELSDRIAQALHDYGNAKLNEAAVAAERCGVDADGHQCARQIRGLKKL